MKILDDQKILNKYSKSRVADTISYLPEQIKESWDETNKIKFPKNYEKFQNIIVCGMGGSNLATELVRSVYSEDLKIPLILVRNYHLPKFVNNKSLVIVSSYSGNTEEVLNCFKEAKAVKAKMFCMAGGGKLLSLAKKNELPYYEINKKYNPGNQPRYGVGSQFGATLSVLDKLGLIKVKKQELQQSIEYLAVLDRAFNVDIDSGRNLAKNLAMEFKGHLPILVAADFLFANTHILNNQINESAKNLCQYYPIPELNHHLMEGLKLPTAVTSKIKFLFFNSNMYSERIAKRFEITEKVLKKQGIKFIDYYITGKSELLASLEILLLGSWVSYYLTILNEQNPTAIPYVDYFKKELDK